MVALTVIIVLVVAPIVAVTGFFAVEVLAGLRRLAKLLQEGPYRRVVVVIPAHEEESVIADTVSSIVRHATGASEVLVVADNCTDQTADVAISAGARVVVRDDKEQRGKGYALALAREQLRSDPPDVVIILDADCRIEGASLTALAGAAAASARPCQAVNLLAPDLSAPPMVQISSFAFMVKNLIRQRGLERLAGRAHLTGTGMALPWPIFDTADLGGSNIVEDLALGLDLADRGTAPMLVEQATVWSPSASADGTLVQRRRWEGGYIATASRIAPAALLRSLRKLDSRAVCAALDLSVPPLALLVLLNVAAFVLGVAAATFGAAVWPLVVMAVLDLLAGFALALAWLTEGRRFASAGTLARLPLYLVWKLPLYLGLARRGAPKEWLRTGR